MRKMRPLISVVVGFLAVVPASTVCGQKPAEVGPVAEQIVPFLVQFRGQPNQQQMFKAIGACEKVREASGRNAVAEALKRIAQRRPDVQEQALSLLSRYLSVEEYGNFVKALKTRK